MALQAGSLSPAPSPSAPYIDNFPDFNECFVPRPPPAQPPAFRSDVEVAALLYPAHIPEEGNSLDDGNSSSGSSYGSGGSVCGGGGGGGGGGGSRAGAGSSARRRRARWPLSPGEANVDAWWMRAHPQLRTPPRESATATAPTARGGRAATGAEVDSEEEAEDLAQRLGALWLAASPSTPRASPAAAAASAAAAEEEEWAAPPSPIVGDNGPPSPLCASPAAPPAAPRSGGEAGRRRLTYSAPSPPSTGALLYDGFSAARAGGSPPPTSARLAAAQADPALGGMRNAAARSEYRRWLASRGLGGGGSPATAATPPRAATAAARAPAEPTYAAQAAYAQALLRGFTAGPR